MFAHYSRIGLAALSLTALGLCVHPGMASAQDAGKGSAGPSVDPVNAKIDLDLESTNLYYGLKLLFSQVKANFTIDESLKSLTVTAHLSQVPFRIALETLLKSTSSPLTYKVESGIYSVVPKVEEAQAPPDQPASYINAGPSIGYKIGIIRPNSVSAIDIVQAFRGVVVMVGYDPKTSTFGNGGLGGVNGGFGGMGAGGVGGFGNSGSGSSGFGSSGLGGSGFGSGGLGSGGLGGAGLGGANGRGGF